MPAHQRASQPASHGGRGPALIGPPAPSLPAWSNLTWACLGSARSPSLSSSLLPALALACLSSLHRHVDDWLSDSIEHSLQRQSKQVLSTPSLSDLIHSLYVTPFASSSFLACWCPRPASTTTATTTTTTTTRHATPRCPALTLQSFRDNQPLYSTPAHSHPATSHPALATRSDPINVSFPIAWSLGR